MPKSQRAAWLQSITKTLEATGKRVLTLRELKGLLSQNSSNEFVEPNQPPTRVIRALVDARVLGVAELFPLDAGSQPNAAPVFTRFTFKKPLVYEIALSLRQDSYLSHSSAAYIHGLAAENQEIHVNKEQRPKRAPSSGLTQAAIDRAFASNPRKTNYVLTDGAKSFLLLNGKHTGNWGVETLTHQGRPLRVTNLPRTLVDLVVRPQYGGGSLRVLEAMRRANGRVGVAELMETLRRLAHVYPYHQSIGFYLETAGFPQQETDQLLKLGLSHDFYLVHRSGSTTWNAKWRVHHPPELTESRL